MNGQQATTSALPQFIYDLLAAGPPRAGEGVNSYLFRLARVLHPYRNDDDIVNILRAVAVECGRFVPLREIRRAVQNSRAAAWKQGQATQERPAPAWPPVDLERRAAVIAATGLALVDVWEMSPIRFEDDASRAEDIIDVLFPENPLLCIGKSKSKFATRPREEWRRQLAGLRLIVPSPMTARTGQTQEGKESAHSLANTGPRKFIIIELDEGSIDDQASVIMYLAGRGAPLTLVVHSGGKSLHSWFYCEGEPDERLHKFMRVAVSLGADPITWIKSQFVRLPDATRENGQRQVVYYFDPAVLK